MGCGPLQQPVATHACGIRPSPHHHSPTRPLTHSPTTHSPNLTAHPNTHANCYHGKRASAYKSVAAAKADGKSQEEVDALLSANLANKITGKNVVITGVSGIGGALHRSAPLKVRPRCSA